MYKVWRFFFRTLNFNRNSKTQKYSIITQKLQKISNFLRFLYVFAIKIKNTT